jgi:hypothetical protein
VSAGLSPLAMRAKSLIDATWLNNPPYDLASQAAFALESAQMLQSPVTAAERAAAEDALALLDRTLAELKREHQENARLRARVVELEQQVEALRAQGQTLREKAVGQPADGLTRIFAPTQALREVLDGEHYEVVHHDYRLGHDLPEAGGAL